ncbi:MAG: (5-formylfuran-3-yl)methyl phosphate synthase [Candidatus Altiarchaeota archaeon]|nr:(5-formylfuran-3-yl)methyl phosphate synthase [Candidatus Altiarchaeota archaeon]
MRLLVSPRNRAEAMDAVQGGADIIDVKNPDEGSLGANYPWVISEIRGVVPKAREVSAALGDFPYLPGTASLAAWGAASLGVDYVKIGLYGAKNLSQGLGIASSVVKSVRECNAGVKVVVAGYADYELIDSVSPVDVLKASFKAGADVYMLDTALKDGRNLFDHISSGDLARLANLAHEKGLLVAVGGSLDGADVKSLLDAGIDILGVRGAVCSRGDRVGGCITRERVKTLKGLIENTG